MSLVVEDLFCRRSFLVLVFFISDCSADSCEVGVLVRGGKLLVSVLCRLDHSSLSVADVTKLHLYALCIQKRRLIIFYVLVS